MKTFMLKQIEKRSSHGSSEAEAVTKQHPRASFTVEGKTLENGKVTYSLPHRAKVVEDSAGTPLFMEYKGRKVADV
jgi:large subunit ribosomal protein L32